MFPIYCTIISNKLQGSAVFSAKRGQRAGLVAKYEPQATAVELAQLGEGCRGQAAPCKEWVISNDRNLREIIVKCCSPSQKQKTSGKL